MITIILIVKLLVLCIVLTFLVIAFVALSQLQVLHICYFYGICKYKLVKILYYQYISFIKKCFVYIYTLPAIRNKFVVIKVYMK